ncbi:hypothetical protein OG601_47290 [Streptomyces sp. NBC_01239]|uniref:hypothetical protein n=1 Tax=Streptomyces sp. NBC_01239 TaxID=2903792 RepID=UPI00225209E3|nr:hypothetical protein [Streptomyces sp. NBC_01239]MCX4816732.1 hypothetical protein [Streptomyces sp. NBC_01239]MCX4818180.1 hypothetical protein [Streptomyces sp. NBC_01239]
MIGLIVILAIAYACARGIENGMADVSKQHKKRVAKAAKKNGRKTGAKLAAWTATGATATGTFLKGFKRGWRREWPKAKERAATKFGRYEPEPEIGDGIGRDGAPATGAKPVAEPTPTTVLIKTEPAAPARPVAPAATEARALILIKSEGPDTTAPTHPDTTGAPMALATIPEITGVNTLKQAVARFASEAGVTAEEAGAIAQRAQEQLAAIEAAIEQATALEFDDDGGTLQELAALRDQYAAALAAAQAMQKAAVDNAAIAAQSSRNIHTRHAGIQEAVAATGGRMAAKQAYTADI